MKKKKRKRENDSQLCYPFPLHAREMLVSSLFGPFLRLDITIERLGICGNRGNRRIRHSNASRVAGR